MVDNNESKVEVVEDSQEETSQATNHEEVSEATILEQNEQVEEDNNQDSNQIKELEVKLEEATNRLLRAQADFENFKRRSRQEREAAEKYRSQRLLEDLLPVLDNFQRALAVEATDEQSKSVIKGMEMVYRQLQDAVKKEGLEEIEAEGKQFDPNFHQAVMQVEDDSVESNVIVEELQKGYILKDRVIRPSMVKVNQ